MIKDTLRHNESVLPNSREMAALREYFPACFKVDGHFDAERFEEFLSNKLTVTHDGYELKFLGKNYGRLLASLDTTTVVVPDEAHNAEPENADSENIYISGDNLDGLKHLLKSYSHKVKCIYIDPPYNTGSDGFVYNDSFNFTVEELSDKLSIDDVQAQRILDLTKRGSASHSAWLMFMYPRLLLARDLLTEDGVIFISIDDNEQSNLKLLCDDVFGEENFIECFPRVTKKGGKSSSDTAKNHDYILAYSKKSDCADLIGVSHNDEGYCNKDKYFEERGYYKANQTLDYDSLGYVKSLDYPIKIDGETFVSGGDIDMYKQRHSGQHGRADWGWRWSKEKFEFGYANGFIEIHRGGVRPRIYTKTYQKVKIEKVNNQYKIIPFNRTKPLSTLAFTDNKYSNDNAKKAFEAVMEKGVFEYTKPPELIEQLVQLVNGNDFYVLDFFSGSGTTAQSILELNEKINKENGDSYKFILVQLPERIKTGSEAERQGYRTIDQIGIERIKRAAAKIRKEHPDTTADLGFRHYTLAEPSQYTLDKLEKFDPNENSFFTSDLLTEFGKPTVLATWLNRDGYGLTAKPEEIDFAGYKGYYIGQHLYLIDKKLTNEAIEAILNKFETDGNFNPKNVVLFGYSFLWTEREALQTNLKRLKDTDVNFDIRY